jgi:hypothetical protein
MMSHNRLVFAAGFAILVLAAIGLDVLSRGPVPWRWWSSGPAALLLGLGLWCGYRTMVLPEPLYSHIEQSLRSLSGSQFGWIHDFEHLAWVQAWFERHYAAAAFWCGLGAVGWFLLWARRPSQSTLSAVLGAFMMGDLLWFAYGRSEQCDKELYYPQVPVLQQIAQSVPGRVMGFNCLPANLASMCGLCDIRGDDGVDPARLVDLLAIAADPASLKVSYAATQSLSPKASMTSKGNVQLSPILDMLGVRYVIFRGTPVPGARPAFQGADYWALTNPAALPRAFIPRRAELEPNKELRLKKLASPEFDPRDVAYVEVPVQLPNSCRGTAEIVHEIPTRISVSVKMETPGLVVLADLWDKGWQAYLNGTRVPILRADHAVRAVVVPRGFATLEFRYEPASFAWGLRLSGGAALVLLGWLGVILWRQRSAEPAVSNS